MNIQAKTILHYILEQTLNSVETLDPSVNRWRFVKPMSTARKQFSLIATPAGLYAMGGWDSSKQLDSVECYNPATDCWTVVASMLTP